MEVSTKLFNAQATKNFAKINEQIQDTQAKIASGKAFSKLQMTRLQLQIFLRNESKKYFWNVLLRMGIPQRRLDLADSG